MDMVDYRDGYGGLQRWIWWTTEIISVVYHVHLSSPPCPSL
jgi:hypothetical protein